MGLFFIGVELLLNKFTNRSSVSIDDSMLFDEFNCLKQYVNEEKINEWRELKTPVDQRWVECFKHFETKQVPCANLKLLAELVHSLPGTNAPVERVFTLMNNFWTANKSQLKVETMKCMLLLKCNVNLSCAQFHDTIKVNSNLVKAIHSSDKY